MNKMYLIQNYICCVNFRTIDPQIKILRSEKNLLTYNIANVSKFEGNVLP